MKLLIAGDFCPQQRVAELFEHGEYNAVLGEVKPIIEKVDYSIANFECAVTYGGEKPIEKCGPNLHCSKKGIEAVKWVGFNCLTLANNHFYDFGDKGVDNTLTACKEYGIDTVGGGMNIQEASKVFYKTINGQTLAIINCCEHEFSIATDTSGGSNPLNPIQQYYSIHEARKNADFVLVIVHGGHEHYQLPSLRMQETYRFFIDAGADAVINHHQHCFSGYEMYNGKPIFYGLGNFCFDEIENQNGMWNDGFMLIMELESDIKIEIIPYVQCAENPAISWMKSNCLFEEKLNELNRIIADGEKLSKKQKDYYESFEIPCKLIIEPFNIRLVKALQRRKIIPFFFSKRFKLKLYNYIVCESHREKMIFNLH